MSKKFYRVYRYVVITPDGYVRNVVRPLKKLAIYEAEDTYKITWRELKKLGYEVRKFRMESV